MQEAPKPLPFYAELINLHPDQRQQMKWGTMYNRLRARLGRAHAGDRPWRKRDAQRLRKLHAKLKRHGMVK